MTPSKRKLVPPFDETQIDELDEVIESDDDGDWYTCVDVYGNDGTVYVPRKEDK